MSQQDPPRDGSPLKLVRRELADAQEHSAPRQSIPFQSQSAQIDPAGLSLLVQNVSVEINGEAIDLNADSPTLSLDSGDHFEVVEIQLASSLNQSVVRAEGYVSKLSDTTSRSEIDFNDGRFSAEIGKTNLSAEDRTIAGLNGGWFAEPSWDQLSLNLIEYTSGSSEVIHQVHVDLIVEDPSGEDLPNVLSFAEFEQKA